MTSLKQEFYEECTLILEGKTLPYHKVGVVFLIVITLGMSLFLHHNFIAKAPLVVVDLDHSKYSEEIINQINTSQYMSVEYVFHEPKEPERFLTGGEYLGVIYLPKGLEKSRHADKKAEIGLFLDYTNTGQTSGVINGLNQIIGSENANITAGGGGGLNLVQRQLFNPQGSYANTIIIGFWVFFLSMFFVFATAGMVPRMRMFHAYEAMLHKTPLHLIIRLVPYAIIYLVISTAGLLSLHFINDLRVAGNPFLFIFLQFFFIMSVGMLGLWFGWHSPNPGAASSKMIIFIPPGFVLGGVTIPLPIFDGIVRAFTHLFPLAWEYDLVRDILLRGSRFWDMAGTIGGFLIYVALVALLLSRRFHSEQKLLAAKSMNKLATATAG